MKHTRPNTSLRRQRLQRRQSGFTLVELAFALVLMGVLIAGVVAGYTTMRDRAYASSIGNAIVQSSVGIQHRYATQPAGSRYDGITFANSEAALTEDLRSSLNGAETQLLMEWQATATIGETTAVGGTGDTNFMWTINNLPRTPCETILTVVAQAATVVINDATGTTIVRNKMTDDILSGPDIGTVCSADAASNSFRAVF